MNEQTTTTDPPKKRFWSLWIYRCTVAVCVLGLLIRFTVKDSILVASTLFYATPLGVLICGFLIAALFAKRLSYSRPVWIWVLCALLCFGFWLRIDWRWNRAALTRPHELEPLTDAQALTEVTVLFWNVARRKDLTAAADQIRKIDADIVGLVEVVGRPKDHRAFFKEQLPEYDHSVLGGGLQILVKGTSSETTPYQITKDSRVRQITATVRGVEYECLIADIESSPFRLRKTPLEKTTVIAESLAEKRLILMGDFNTPSDSVYLAKLRKNHTLAYDAVGEGYAPTWPLPFPVLTLDQVWTNGNLRPVQCEHGHSSASDHRFVLTTLRHNHMVAEPGIE